MNDHVLRHASNPNANGYSNLRIGSLASKIQRGTGVVHREQNQTSVELTNRHKPTALRLTHVTLNPILILMDIQFGNLRIGSRTSKIHM